MNADAQEPQHALALRPGVLLADRFRLVRSLRATSSFAFSYFADDLTTGDTVVIKEFFPRNFVSRGADGLTVRSHSPECERDFLRALHRFALEGAALAESGHPNLVQVRAVVDANGTAYLVMQQHDAQPLADYLRAVGGRLAPSDAGRIAQDLLSALQVLHTDSIIHRDVSPRSVHVGANGSAILLEFSARRHLPMHASDLAPGFAAFEQYGMRDIGPWTDVYAVSSLLYYMLTGTTPPSALDRAAGETVVSPLAAVPGLAPGLARLVVKGMALLPQQRPHAVSELRRQLDAALAESSTGASRATPGSSNAELGNPEIGASMGDGTTGEYDRNAPLRLAAGGIVVPGEERGMQLLRKLGSAASRLRRSLSPEVPSTPIDASALDLDEAAPAPRASVPPSEAPRVAVSERPAPMVAAPTFSAPAVLDVVAAPAPLTEAPLRGLDIAAEIAESEAMQAHLEREASRRRYRVAAAAGLVLIVAGSLVALARIGRASGMKPQPATVATAPETPAAPAVAVTSSDSHVTVDGGAVQQSATRPAPDSPAPVAKHVSTPEKHTSPAPAQPAPAPQALPSGKLPNVKIALSSSTTPDLKIVPPEILVDARTRLTNGEDQAEQGDYQVARRMFKGAMVQLDSAVSRYPDSQAIKNLRRDLEQADARAAQACTAENEMRRRRGEQVRACQ